VSYAGRICQWVGHYAIPLANRVAQEREPLLPAGSLCSDFQLGLRNSKRMFECTVL
jgi:hypothetical protein